jgi:hypothetical protein
MDLQSIALATWPCRLSAGNIRGRRGRRRGGITRSWGCLRLRSGGWVIRTGPVAGPVTILAASCNRASGAHRPGSGGAPRDACAGPRRAGGGRSWRASSRPAARELVRCPVRGSWNASRARTNCAGSPWSPSTPLSSSVDAEASPSAVLRARSLGACCKFTYLPRPSSSPRGVGATQPPEAGGPLGGVSYARHAPGFHGAASLQNCEKSQSVLEAAMTVSEPFRVEEGLAWTDQRPSLRQKMVHATVAPR